MNANLRGAAIALAAFGLYSTHDVVVKLLGETYSTFQIIFFAQLLSFPLISVVRLTDPTDGNLIARRPGWSILRALATVNTGLMAFYAFAHLPMAQTYAILFALPLIVTLLSIPMLGEKVGLHRGLAVLMGLVGVLIVLRPGSVPLSLGHLAGIGAACTGALSSVITRKIGNEERSVVLLLYPMVTSVVLMGLAMPFVYKPMPLADLGLAGVIAFLGMIAAFLTILAYRAAPAVIVAPMQYSQILWAAFYGWLFFGEGIDGWTMLGTAVIIASGVYIVLREGQPDVSKNRPVLENRSRLDTAILPRISLWLRRLDRRAGGGDPR